MLDKILAFIADKLNWSGFNYTWDINTANTADTWVPVMNGNLIQHRVEPNWVIEEYYTKDANKWSYRKWNNGAVELWSVHYWASLSWTAYLGTGLYYGNFTSYAYPFNVYTSQAPVMTGNVRYVNANVGWLANLDILDNTHCKGTIVRNGNSGNVYVGLHVNGWWK